MRHHHEMADWDRSLCRGAEVALWDSFCAGAVVTPGSAAIDQAAQVRGELIAALLRNERLVGAVDRPAVRLRSVRVVGDIDLSDATLVGVLDLRACGISGDLILNDANARAIRLSDCRLNDVQAVGLRLTGSFDLSRSQLERIVLRRAVIDGDLVMDGCQVTGSAAAVDVSDATVANILCRPTPNHEGTDQRFRLGGPLLLYGTVCHGRIAMDAAVIANGGGDAIDARNLRVTADVAWRGHITTSGDVDAFSTVGAIRLTGAHIGGVLDMAGAQLNNREGLAIVGSTVVIDGRLFLRPMRHLDGELVRHFDGTLAGPSHCYGRIRLNDARIGGIDFDGTTIIHDSPDDAVEADRIEVAHDMRCGGLLNPNRTPAVNPVDATPAPRPRSRS